MKLIPPFKIPTPFGEISTPPLETPPAQLPRMPDDKGKAAIAHAIGHDLAGVLTIIPMVGEFVAGNLADIHFYKIRTSLTPEQYEKFIKYDKFLPTDVLPLIRAVSFED